MMNPTARRLGSSGLPVDGPKIMTYIKARNFRWH